MILNSHHESFSKSVMFLRAFQKIPQNVQQKEKGGVDNAESMIKENSKCTAHVCSKIENTTNLQK